MNEKKILLIGPPAAGKSSIVLSTFGYVEPDLVLNTNLEPTIGIEIMNFQHHEMIIGIFDLAGQEINTWLTKERKNIFPGTDILIAVFEYKYSKNQMIELLKQYELLLAKYKIPYFYIFLHKIDILRSNKLREKYLVDMKNLIDKNFSMDRFRIFGTSIHPNHFKKLRFTIDWILNSLEISLELQTEPKPQLLFHNTENSDFCELDFDEDLLVELSTLDSSSENDLKKKLLEFDKKEEDKKWQD